MTSSDITPAGEPLEVLFERTKQPAFPIPDELTAVYGGAFALPATCVYANFVASLDGIVALPGDTESGQIISGKNPADRFVMGMLRAVADAVLIGAGTFRKSQGHAWTAERIYPNAREQYAELRRRLGLAAQPRLALLSASGDLDPNEPALRDAWVFTTRQGEARLRSKIPESTRLIVREAGELSPAAVVEVLRGEGLPRVLTEGGPSLFADLIRSGALDALFLTSAPTLFGRFPNDERKSLVDGLDVGGARLELDGIRRHRSHLFLRYSLAR